MPMKSEKPNKGFRSCSIVEIAMVNYERELLYFTAKHRNRGKLTRPAAELAVLQWIIRCRDNGKNHFCSATNIFNTRVK